jgi:monooxygenase
VQRAVALLPRQGTVGPWRMRQNYFADRWTLRFGRIDDGTLQCATPQAPGAGAAALQPTAAP